MSFDVSSYASTPYGSDVRPSYSFSYFIKRIPNVLIEGGGIRGLKKIEIAGSTQFEWGRQVLPGEQSNDDLLDMAWWK